MINVKDIPKTEAPKIDVDKLLKEIEQDVLDHKLDMDGRDYDLVYDVEGINKVKKVLEGAGFEALYDLTGFRNGIRMVSLMVAMKRT